jgi:glutathione S-transferase
MMSGQMKLRYSAGSPFVRKVVVAARLLGLADRVQFVDGADDPGDAMRGLNPLHKMPLLLCADDTTIYDSPVILEYFDSLAGGGKIIPPAGPQRFWALTRQALADGLTEAVILIRYEDRWREPHQRSDKWIAHQQTKIDRALDAFEADPPDGAFGGVDQISLLCAVDFLERRAGPAWRAKRPRLSAWLDHVLASVPAAAETRPPL